MKQFIILAIILVSLTCVVSQDIYDFQKTKLQKITQFNFDNHVIKGRSQKFLQIVQFYKTGDGKSKSFAKDFDKFATDYQGIFKISVVNCDNEVSVCGKEKIKTYPTIRFYPQNPIPTFDLEGEVTTQKIMSIAQRYVQSNVVEVNSENVETFINESPSVPKVLLFTDKKGIPMIFKGLSINFEQKLFFGIVRSHDDNLMIKYKIKNTPSIIVVKANEKKTQLYKGEINFKDIFEFLNIYSEAFVAGGGSSQDSAAAKVWMTEAVPQLFDQSANDICLKQEGMLCVIIINKGKPEKQQFEVLKEAQQAFQKKISRGTKFGFMWLDATIENDWVQIFKVQDFPSVVVLNPGKRKRFIPLQGEITSSNIQQLLEKINGGDARFAAISALPEFVTKKE